jgi:predicted RNA binding protein YcfA (HicA-like mRNA interferase family)
VQNQKTLEKILQGNKNIRFNEMAALIQAYGFKLSRVSGSHHIFIKNDVDVIVNIQNVKGKAKPYQVKQFIKIIEIYSLEMTEGE